VHVPEGMLLQLLHTPLEEVKETPHTVSVAEKLAAPQIKLLKNLP
jgi:hypothetical protein